jgi:hypothetical protein
VVQLLNGSSIMNNIKHVQCHLDGFSFSDTFFRCESTFLESEVNLFSKTDRENIWAPDGIPFKGEFDVYLKVFKNNIFQGFFRLEIFPWNEINLHISFPSSNSFKSRYFLQTTSYFLSLLNDLVLKYNIYCIVDSDNRNVVRYMNYFEFKRIGDETELVRYKFENLKNLINKI